MDHFLNPIEAVKRSKKKKNLWNFVQLLLISSVILAISAATVVYKMSASVPSQFGVSSMMSYGAATAGVVIFFMVFAGGLFFGYVLSTVFKILTGRGAYFQGLMVLAFSLMPLSLGMLIAAVAFLIPYIGPVISFTSITMFGAISYATMFRASKEVFNIDMITALVGATVIIAVLFFAFYFTVLISLTGLASTIMPTTTF